tara:strand:- start:2302 stop:2496 length:195 start_codon:yes stop_codon:yes gene_type:complete
MTILGLTQSLAIRTIATLINRKVKSEKSVESKPVHTYETFNEIKGDVMDYDGMGNYGRFPCINK